MAEINLTCNLVLGLNWTLSQVFRLTITKLKTNHKWSSWSTCTLDTCQKVLQYSLKEDNKIQQPTAWHSKIFIIVLPWKILNIQRRTKLWSLIRRKITQLKQRNDRGNGISRQGLKNSYYKYPKGVLKTLVE